MKETGSSLEDDTSPDTNDELVSFAQSLDNQPKPTHQCKTWEEYEQKKQEYDHEMRLYQHRLEVYKYTLVTIQNNNQMKMEVDSGYLALDRHCPLSGVLLYCMDKRYSISHTVIHKGENGVSFWGSYSYTDSILSFLRDYGQGKFLGEDMLLQKGPYIWGSKNKDDVYVVTQQDIKDNILPPIAGFSVYTTPPCACTEKTYSLVPYFEKPTPPLLPQPIPPKTPKSVDKKPGSPDKKTSPEPKKEENISMQIDTTTSKQKTITHAYNIGGAVTKEGVTGGTRVTKSVYDLYTSRYAKEKTKGRSYEDFKKNYLPTYLKE